jgi:hypothetical protein
MKSATATCSTSASNQSTRIGSIDTPAHTASATNANDVEIGIAHINISFWIKILISIEFYDQWIWMN